MPLFPRRRRDVPFAAALLLLLAAGAAGGCRKSQAPVTEADDASAPANAVSIADAARATAACKWLDSSTLPLEPPFLDPDCPALKAWNEGPGAKASEHERALVVLLRDGEKNARWVAARSLALLLHPTWKKDEELVRLVLDRVVEEDPSVARVVGELIGSLPMDEPRARAAVLSALERTANPSLRAGIAAQLRISDDLEKDKDVRTALVDLAWLPGPPAPRVAALVALVYSAQNPRTCQLVLDAARDADGLVSTEASRLLAGNAGMPGCPAQRGALLTHLAASTSLSSGHVQALDRIASTALSDEQKRVVAILRRIVETKTYPSDLRSAALHTIGERDPAAKEFAKRFLHDEDISIALDASKILGVELSLDERYDHLADAGARDAAARDAAAPKGERDGADASAAR